MNATSCRGHVTWRPRLHCYSVWAPVGGVKGRMEIEIDRVQDMAEGATILATFLRSGHYRAVYARRQCPDATPRNQEEVITP